MSVNSKMTALADEIRELSNTTDPKSIDAMTSDINEANTEINSQSELIAQIAIALEGKSSGGGVTLPPLDNPASTSDILSGKEAIDGDGNKITGTIVAKTSSNLTASGATVTVPAGYYASDANKSVATATQATPTVSIDSAGKITATSTQTAGYVTAGTKTDTKQLTTQAAKTVTPTTSSQTAVASGVYTTGAVTVGAIPSDYIVPSGTKTITTNGTHDVKAYASATVNVPSEDVGEETNTYTSLNTELESVIDSLPNAGSGGGGNIETCEVTITVAYYPDSNELKYFYIPTLENSNVSLTCVSTPTIVSNAIKNSRLYGIYSEYAYTPVVSVDGTPLQAIQFQPSSMFTSDDKQMLGFFVDITGDVKIEFVF